MPSAEWLALPLPTHRIRSASKGATAASCATTGGRSGTAVTTGRWLPAGQREGNAGKAGGMRKRGENEWHIKVCSHCAACQLHTDRNNRWPGGALHNRQQKHPPEGTAGSGELAHTMACSSRADRPTNQYCSVALRSAGTNTQSG